MEIDGSINPLISAFVHKGIEKAKTYKADCLIIHLNTPGGLLKSTRVIVSDILSSSIPVVVYVSPENPGKSRIRVRLFSPLSSGLK